VGHQVAMAGEAPTPACLHKSISLFLNFSIHWIFSFVSSLYSDLSLSQFNCPFSRPWTSPWTSASTS